MLILFIKGLYGVIFSSYHLNEAYSRKNIVKYFQMVIREANIKFCLYYKIQQSIEK